MTLSEYLAVLRRSWIWIVVATVVGALLATGVSMAMTPIYQAKTRMFVSVRVPMEKGYHYSGDVFVSQRVASYLKVVDSPTVLEPVIRQLGLDTTPKDLAEEIDVTSPTGTVLYEVTASDPDPDQAARLANAIAASYAAEIERLEGAAAAQRGSAGESSQVLVKVSVLNPAEVPEEPASPRTLLNVALGTLLGFLIGVGVAVLRYSLDKSLKSVEDLEEAVRAPALGVVPSDPGSKDEPLAALSSGPRAEPFRTIRTNLRFVDVDDPPHTVVITSAIPGEGKTTTACNLAIALGRAGAKVLLVEGDLRRPQVADYLGIDGSVGITDILIGQAGVDSCVVEWSRGPVDLLPSGSIPPNANELLGSRQMKELLQELRGRYDAVVINAPAVLAVTDAAVLATGADGVILVARYGSTSREQVAEAADRLRQVHARVLGAILNFAPSRREGEEYGYGRGGAATSLDEQDMPSPAPRI